MNEMQNKLFDSLLEYWQQIIDKIVKELTIAYPGSSGNTRQAITIENVNPIGKTNTGYKVSLFMPDYYQFMDEGVSGAKYNTGISRFRYKDKMPPISAIRRFMINRGINKFSDIKSKRGYSGTNTKSGKRRDAEDIRKSIAFVIARSIYNYGLDKTNFYSNVINDKELLAFEQKLIDEYGDFILDVIKV